MGNAYHAYSAASVSKLTIGECVYRGMTISLSDLIMCHCATSRMCLMRIAGPSIHPLH